MDLFRSVINGTSWLQGQEENLTQDPGVESEREKKMSKKIPLNILLLHLSRAVYISTFENILLNTTGTAYLKLQQGLHT
jgi:hypothetical protein